MSTTDDTNAARRGSGSNDLLGPAPERADLCAALRAYQQADADGVMVLVSRQAVCEAALEIERQACQINGLMFDALGEPRTRYVRVTLDGSHCVLDAREGDRYVADARAAGDDAADRYVVRDVYLSEREFDALPEFDGF